MPKRPTYTLDQNRRYIEEQQRLGNYPGKMPGTAGQIRRVAGALRSGKRGREIQGHGKGESRPAQRHRSNVRRFVYKSTSEGQEPHEKVLAAGGQRAGGNTGYGKRLEGKVAYRIGPTPKTEYPWQQRGHIPQPDEIARMIERNTKTTYIIVGIWGWLLRYVDPEEEEPGWMFPHAAVSRDWLLGRLKSLPLDHTYTAQDPAYTAIAHDIFAPADSGNDIWVWSWVFQWSVRDR